MQALINTIQSYYEKFMGFFGSFWDFFKNYFQSSVDFLKDLPAYILRQIFEAVIWVLDQISAMMPANGSDFAGYLSNAMGTLDPAVLYALNRSGFLSALAIIGLAAQVWAAIKVLQFIRG